MIALSCTDEAIREVFVRGRGNNGGEVVVPSSATDGQTTFVVKVGDYNLFKMIYDQVKGALEVIDTE